MATIKKLLFAPLLLVAFTALMYQLPSIFKSSDFIFSLSMNNLFQLIIISCLITSSSFLFTIFAALSFDLKLILPVNLLISIIPMFFLDQAVGIILAVALFIVLLVSFVSLENTLKTYLNFQPTVLFGPAIRHLSSFLILIITVSYFLAISKDISKQGFQIPDSLIDTALQFTPQPQTEELESNSPQFSVSSEQLELLRKNPEILKQSGLDPNLAKDLIKQTVKDQVQGIIKPYLPFIPAILALLLFLTFQSLTSMINLLIYPLLWFVFLVLEKTGYIKFTTEMRPVKKMVI